MIMRTALLLAAAVGLMAEDLPAWKQAFVPEGDTWKQTEQHFRFNNGTEPETLDPQLITGVPESRVASGLFEGLLSLRPGDLGPAPGVAKAWTVSDDGLVYTFTIREDAAWSDGTAITAQTFVDSWKRLLDPATASEYVYQLYPVANAEAIFKGDEPFEKLGVEVVNPTTLKVTLHQPCPWFLELTAFHTLYPVPTHVIAEHGESWTRPEHIVGNGPFVLSEWSPRQQIVMEPNGTYWDADFVKLSRITAYPYDELNTALQKFRKDELDWMPGVPQEKIDELRADPDYFAMPYLGIYFYRFNTTKAPFDNVLVRKALTLAIDRRTITEDVTKAGQRPVSYFCPPMGDYKPAGGLDYDPQAAKKALADAGFPNGEGFPPFAILYNTSEAHKQIAETIVQQWQDTLGITASLENSEWKTYLARLRNLDYAVARSAWIGDYYDPNTYDELLKESQRVLDPALRNELFTKMENRLLVEEAVVAPIYNYVYQGMLKERVLGFEHNLRDVHPFQYLWLED
jgi:oligopeptide transport system substrate-binding protein